MINKKIILCQKKKLKIVCSEFKLTGQACCLQLNLDEQPTKSWKLIEILSQVVEQNWYV